ncbi:MAG: hypothetical protein U0136_16815 [Bdellovibrionota bacterium]
MVYFGRGIPFQIQPDRSDLRVMALLHMHVRFRGLFGSGLRSCWSRLAAHRRSFRSLVTAVILFSFASDAAAQFLQTDLSTYQLPDPKQEIVIITTPRGMFVSQRANRSGSLSGFDPEQLTLGNSTSVFLGYATGSRVPEKIILPGPANEFRIRGTFSLQLSNDVRISVSMNNGSVPYITVVHSSKEQPSIIGFLGGQVVLNLGGKEAVELLEADTLRRQYNTVVEPYSVKPDHHLYLSGERLPDGSAVGLMTPQENDCLLEDARLVQLKDYQDIFQLKLEEQKPALKKLMNDAKKSLTLNVFVILNASPERITAVNAETGKLVIIRSRELSDIKACTVEPVVLRKD